MKKIQFLLILLTTLWTVQGQSGYDYAVPYGSDSLYFKAVSGGVMLVDPGEKYSGLPLSGKLEIPSYITLKGQKLNVVEIDAQVFTNCTEITSVELPNTVKHIGFSAFANCSKLQRVQFPQKLTSLGGYAFENCTKLDTVILPDTITTWGGGSFSGCSKLRSVSIPVSTLAIPERTFKGCVKLSKVHIGGNVEEIGEEAFAKCTSLARVTFGVKLKHIKNDAFNGCTKLDSVFLPIGVDSVEPRAFYECKGLKSLVVDANNKHYDSRDSCNAIIISATNTLILGCDNTTVPDGVERIADYALFHCFFSTKELIIPNSVVEIGSWALACNNQLEKIQLPSGLKHLASKVFYANVNLIKVTMPDSLLTIGDSAFCNDFKIDTIVLPEHVYALEEDAFNYCIDLRYIEMKCNLKYIGARAFWMCNQMHGFVLGDSVISIGERAFEASAFKASKLVFPETLDEVKADAFAHCGIDTFCFPRREPIIFESTEGFASKQVLMVPCGTYYDYVNEWSDIPNINKNIVEMAAVPYKHTVNVDAPQHGSAVVVPQGVQDVGCDSSLIVKATANDGWFFYKWSTGSLQNPDTIHLTSDMALTAYFVEDIPPAICKVTVENEHNVLSWSQDNVASAFLVHRYDPVKKKLVIIDSFHVDNATGYQYWEDTAYDSSVGSASYAVSAVDIYGNMSSMSDRHSTISLAVKKDDDGRHTLQWNGYGGYYTGPYSILRGSSPGSMEPVAILSAKDNQMAKYSYTFDSLPTGLPVYYQVVVQLLDHCTPGEDEEVSRSNIVRYSGVGIENVASVDYNVTVSVVEGCIHVRGAEGRRTAVYDMMGRQVATEVPTAPLPRGVYLVRVEGLPAVKAVVMQ